MLGKISFGIFILVLLALEASFLGGGALAVLSMPLVLTVSIMFIWPRTSPWLFLMIGLLSDLLLLRPVGFTSILLLLVIAMCNALRSVFTITDLWGNLIIAIVVIVLGGICENVLFQIIGIGTETFWDMIGFSLVNILGMAACLTSMYIIRFVTHLDVEV